MAPNNIIYEKVQDVVFCLVHKIDNYLSQKNNKFSPYKLFMHVNWCFEKNMFSLRLLVVLNRPLSIFYVMRLLKSLI
jgi:hypothetical protein